MTATHRGLFAIPPTPFTTDGALDEPSLRRTLAFCLEAGTHGIVTPVNASEFSTLSTEERHVVARATVEEFVHVLPFGTGFLGEAQAYTGGTYGFAATQAGIKSPTDAIYQRARDFWAVGAQAKVLPEGLAWYLPKGADFILSTHFHPSGKAEKEISAVGIYFASGPPRQR